MMDETNHRLVREVATLATASRTQIHALHVRPLPAPGARADLQVLPSECRDESILTTGALGYELSLLTGGFADQPTEGLVEGAAFDRLARQLSAWYLLGFEPGAGDRDGRTHRIDVQVANRPGIGVRARRTFYIDPGLVASGATPNPRHPDVKERQAPFRLPEPGQEPPPPLPPPTLRWNQQALRRAQEGLLPFLWLPDWLDTTRRFCAKPELGPDVESVSRWDVDRLQSMTQWLEWLRSAQTAALRQRFVPEPGAAALLHTAASIALVQRGEPDPLFLHLDLAASLLDPGNGPSAVQDPLRRLWYHVTPQWLLAYSRRGDALRLVNDGLRDTRTTRRCTSSPARSMRPWSHRCWTPTSPTTSCGGGGSRRSSRHSMEPPERSGARWNSMLRRLALSCTWDEFCSSSNALGRRSSTSSACSPSRDRRRSEWLAHMLPRASA